MLWELLPSLITTFALFTLPLSSPPPLLVPATQAIYRLIAL